MIDLDARYDDDDDVTGVGDGPEFVLLSLLLSLLLLLFGFSIDSTDDKVLYAKSSIRFDACIIVATFEHPYEDDGVISTRTMSIPYICCGNIELFVLAVVLLDEDEH